MENQNNQTDEFQIKDIWDSVVRNWYWFFISLIVCSSIAILYLAITPSVYTRSASVLIKDDSGKGSTEMSAFEDLGLFRSGVNVNNEMIIFRSPKLMEEVVQRLDLQVNYEVLDKLKKVELYTNSPIVVKFLSAQDNDVFSFEADILSDGKVKMSNFVVNGTDIDQKPITVPFSDTIQTPAGLLRVSPTLHYTPDYNHTIEVRRDKLITARDFFSSKLTVGLSDKVSTIVNLTLKDVSSRRADDVLNMLIGIYNEQWIKENTQVATNTSNFINDRLVIIESELGGIDSDIEQFKSSNLVSNVQSAAYLLMTEASEYSSKEFEFTNQFSIAQYLKEYLTDQNNALSLIPGNTGLGNLNIESSIGAYNALFLERDKLLVGSSHKNPTIIDMNNSLDAMRQAIIRAIDNYIVSLELQLDGVRGQEEYMTRRMAANPEQEKQLLSIERQQKIKESLYLYLLQKREENELTKEITISNTRIIAPATGKDIPTAPRRSMIFVGALLFGLLIPSIVIWIKLTLNTVVRNKHDLTENVSAPFLGQIPVVDSKTMKSHGPNVPIVQENSRDIVSEAFRVIRTKMDFMLTPVAEKTIMLTSYNPDSGKTFIAINMAMSQALTGKKIAVMDLDMRKASLSEYVKSPRKGISSYLNGTIDNIEEIKVKGMLHKNVDVLPVGIIPPNPAELLLTDRFKEMIAHVGKEYDYVFIDCPPIDIVADASIIAEKVSMVLFVVREGLLDRRILPQLEELYKNGTQPNMAFILNASTSVLRYGYRRQYDYYSKGTDKKKK